MAFDTADEYQSWSGSTVLDATVDIAIAAAQAQIERFLGLDLGGLETAARTELYDGPDHDTLKLRHWPVTTLTSVSYRTAKSTYVALDATTYDVTTRGEVYLVAEFPAWESGTRNCFWRGIQNWQIVYTAGYVVSGGGENRPDDLLAVLREMVTEVLRRRDSDHDPNLTSESMGAYSYSIAADAAKTAMTEGQAKILRRHLRSVP